MERVIDKEEAHKQAFLQDYLMFAIATECVKISNRNIIKAITVMTKACIILNLDSSGVISMFVKIQGENL